MAEHDSRTPQQDTYPPVVTVLGHVDHGKTTLLDAIRKTSIVKRERGGITQSIGASSVVLSHENKLREITFLDTPGHEAFAAMRARGANVADIGLLVVASDDGVMPQTKESITLLQEAKIPFIVVLTKSDVEASNPERVKKQLLKEHVILEGYGGDVPAIEVSAIKNENINELLDLILLVYDLKKESTQKAKSTNPLQAVVIESKLDAKVGPKASVVIKDGTLSIRDEIVCEGIVGRVRSLIDDKGQMIRSATVGNAVEILGFSKPPAVGAIVEKGNKTTERTVGVEEPLKRELVYTELEETPDLSLILVTDSLGSLEAISKALPQEVRVVSSKTGSVSETDILMAKATGSIVLSFNAKIPPTVAKLALIERVLAKEYHVIYEMLDEIRDVLEGKQKASVEQILGRAKVKALFPFDKQTVLGITVLEGRIAKGDKVKIEREDTVVGEALIVSMRTGKMPISKVEKGAEGGILLNKTLDFRVGDVVVSHL